jgi:hypothetical protein
MNVRQIIRPNTVIPVIASAIVGSGLFYLGEMDDSPGLCLIGLILGNRLLYWGVRNMRKINAKIKPIIVFPLLFGTAGTIAISRYLVAGVYDEPPGLIVIGIILSIVLLSAGLIMLKRVNAKTTAEEGK